MITIGEFIELIKKLFNIFKDFFEAIKKDEEDAGEGE